MLLMKTIQVNTCDTKVLCTIQLDGHHREAQTADDKQMISYFALDEGDANTNELLPP